VFGAGWRRACGAVAAAGLSGTILMGVGLTPSTAAAVGSTPVLAASEAPVPADAAGNPNVNLTTPPVCPTSGFCVAVGRYEEPDGGQPGLIETLSGGVWTAVQAPLPGSYPYGDELVNFKSLVCPTAASCVAVGSYVDYNNAFQGLIETLSEGVWTPTEAPLPANQTIPGDQDAVLDDVACSSAGSCVAVGHYLSTPATFPANQGLIETLSDGRWTDEEAPLPKKVSGKFTILNAVACPTAGSCVAVGVAPTVRDADPSGSQGLVETWRGRRWIATTAPLPTGGQADTSSLSLLDCPAAGACVAVGASTGPGELYQPMFERLTKKKWTATYVPVPGDGAPGMAPGISALACPAVNACAAVGEYQNTDNLYQGLIETLSAGTWAPTPAPLPANASAVEDQASAVLALACPAAGDCLAGGSYADTDGHTRPVVETLAGGTWSATEATVAPNESSDPPQTWFETLGCQSAGFCIALGGYADTTNAVQGVIETVSALTPTATAAGSGRRDRPRGSHSPAVTP